MVTKPELVLEELEAVEEFPVDEVPKLDEEPLPEEPLDVVPDELLPLTVSPTESFTAVIVPLIGALRVVSPTAFSSEATVCSSWVTVAWS